MSLIVRTSLTRSFKDGRKKVCQKSEQRNYERRKSDGISPKMSCLKKPERLSEVWPNLIRTFRRLTSWFRLSSLGLITVHKESMLFRSAEQD